MAGGGGTDSRIPDFPWCQDVQKNYSVIRCWGRVEGEEESKGKTVSGKSEVLDRRICREVGEVQPTEYSQFHRPDTDVGRAGGIAENLMNS